MSRRDFAVAAAVGLSAAPASIAAAAEVDEVIDAHSHVWTVDVQKYPLSPPYQSSQMDPPSFTPEELFAHARPLGVRRVVLIQMSYYGFDNSYMLDCMRRAPKTFSGVAVINEDAQPAEAMKMLAKEGVRGFRIHPAGKSVDAWIGSAGMQAMWKAGADQNLAMCCLINPEALPLVDSMCEKHPQTPVVIDHFARIGIDGKIRESHLDQLCRLSRRPKTYVKISAYYALGAKRPPYLDLEPMIRRLIGAYGVDRLMWASDCPYQVQPPHSYRDSVDLIRKRIEGLTSDDRRALLCKTAEKVFFS